MLISATWLLEVPVVDDTASRMDSHTWGGPSGGKVLTTGGDSCGRQVLLRPLLTCSFSPSAASLVTLPCFLLPSFGSLLLHTSESVCLLILYVLEMIHSIVICYLEPDLSGALYLAYFVIGGPMLDLHRGQRNIFFTENMLIFRTES